MKRVLTKPMRTVLLNLRDGKSVDDCLSTVSNASLLGKPIRITPAATVLRALCKRGYIKQNRDASYRITPQGITVLEEDSRQTN